MKNKYQQQDKIIRTPKINAYCASCMKVIFETVKMLTTRERLENLI